MNGPRSTQPAAGTGSPVATPLHVTAAQAELLFERIAEIAATVSALAADSLEAAGTDEEQATRLCAVRDLAALVGSLADSAVGESGVGSVGDWACGPRFAEAGR